MKFRISRFALAATLMASTSLAFGEQGETATVGDLPSFGEGYGEDAYFDEDAAYATPKPVSSARSPRSPRSQDSGARVGDLSRTGDDPQFGQDPGYTEHNPVMTASHDSSSAFVTDSASVDITAAAFEVGTQVQHVSSPMPSFEPSGYIGSGHACDSSCEPGCGFGNGCEPSCGIAGCDGGCGSRCGAGRYMKLSDMLDLCGSDAWATTEALLWFVQDRDTPPLVTTSAPGTLPVIGNNPTVQTVFGDEISGGLSAGFRGDYGKWINDNLGLGGRFWWLAENSDSYSANEPDGSQFSLGRPFVNTGIGSPLAPAGNGNDAVLVAFANIFGGSVQAESTLQAYAAEAYARMRFMCTKSCQLDFIGGYSYFNIEDSLRVSSTTIDRATADVYIFNDNFDTENQFNGGQLGFEFMMTRGRWMARSLTKVHLGNMNQQFRIRGNASFETLGSGIPPSITSGGLLAFDDQGDYERDVFAFAPEAKFKLAYRFRPNVLLSVGYTFLYWDNVALAGDVINPTLDANRLNTNALPLQNAVLDDSSLWVQGVDLGVVIDF